MAECLTRMHSSRMSTVRCSSRLLGGLCPGDLSAWGVSACGGLPSGFLTRGCLPRGLSAQEGGVCLGGYLPGGGCLLDTQLPSVDRMTDACENNTLPQLCCGR